MYWHLLWLGLQGHLIKVDAKGFWVVAGLGGLIFKMLIDIFPYMKPSWFTQTWYQCKLLNIEISMKVHDYEWLQQNNREIIRIFLQQELVGHKLARMNWCWMFLNVVYLSDISTSDGMAIIPQHWEGKVRCDSTNTWPRTEQPTAQDWNMWRNSLTKALSLRHQDWLALQLGEWAPYHDK